MFLLVTACLSESLSVWDETRLLQVGLFHVGVWRSVQSLTELYSASSHPNTRQTLRSAKYGEYWVALNRPMINS